jgi:hypothetical protein
MLKSLTHRCPDVIAAKVEVGEVHSCEATINSRPYSTKFFPIITVKIHTTVF